MVTINTTKCMSRGIQLLSIVGMRNAFVVKKPKYVTEIYMHSLIHYSFMNISSGGSVM